MRNAHGVQMFYTPLDDDEGRDRLVERMKSRGWELADNRLVMRLGRQVRRLVFQTGLRRGCCGCG